MSLLANLERLNRHDPSRFRPFLVEGRRVGWVTPERCEVLSKHRDVFQVEATHLAMASHLATPQMRTAALQGIAPDLAKSSLFLKSSGEMFAVKNTWRDAELMRIDRALVPGLGVRAYGVHVNGFVRTSKGPSLWIATRALTNAVEPGKLDNMVAGGQPAGLSLTDNVIKECAEEAGLSADLAARARPVSTVSYRFDVPQGLKDDVLFCYDLEMPPGLEPANRDGEVTRFDLVPLEIALEWVRRSDRFKFNVGAVIIDFALRHGGLTEQTEATLSRLRTLLGQIG
jgi:8-oxo-dGTP pyrophosphatase MutT (NUDIX family)